jgi:hypothetical protein
MALGVRVIMQNICLHNAYMLEGSLMNLGTKKDHILQGECCPINFEGVMAL